MLKRFLVAIAIFYTFTIPYARAQPSISQVELIRGVASCADFIQVYQVCQDLTGQLYVGNGVAAVPAGAQQAVYDNGSCTTTKTINGNNGARQKVTLGGNCTITFTIPTASTYVFLKVVQNSGAHYNIAWSNAKWAAGLVPVITQTDAAVDVISCYLDTEGVYCQFSQDFH